MNLHCAIIPQRLIAVFLTVSVVCGFATTEEMAFAAQGPQSSVRIVVEEGNLAVNVIAKNHVPSRQIVVRVVDQTGKPVRGVTVSFQMPPVDEPGGTIGGQSAVSSLTGSAGLVRVTIQPNQLAGTFDIEVSASYQRDSSSATITQFNVQAAGNAAGHDKLWRFLGLGAATAVVTALVASRSSSTTATPVKQSPRG
jgi:hypothetical protein